MGSYPESSYSNEELSVGLILHPGRTFKCENVLNLLEIVGKYKRVSLAVNRLDYSNITINPCKGARAFRKIICQNTHTLEKMLKFYGIEW